MRSILFFLILSFTSIFSQHKFRNELFNNLPEFFYEFVNCKHDSNNVITFFKISYDRLIFSKENKEYKAGLILNLEIKDSTNYVLRKSHKSTVSTVDFNLTNSKNNYLQDFLEFYLPDGKYIVDLSIELINSNELINIGSKHLLVKSDEFVKSPIIVYSDDKKNGELELVNFSDILPFTEKKLDLLFPINSVENDYPITVELTQNNKIVYSSNVENIYKMNLSQSQNRIVFVDSFDGINFLRVKNINSKLREGNLKIKLSNNKFTSTFSKEIKWINKPISLKDSENAIELLKLIDNPEKIDSLLDLDENQYSNVIYDYWKRYDSDTSNVYNDSMFEFYNRIDYSDKNFSVFNKKKGSTTDRGKIFIKYGSPDETKRIYSKLDLVKEIWIYKNPKMMFTFVDNSGTGNYTLESYNE